MYPTLFSNNIARLQMRSVDKSGYFKPAALATIALLLAAIPTIRWYVLRLQDGGGELTGLVPLAAAIWFAVRDRKALGLTSRGVWIAAVLLLLQAATFPFLPAMIRALLMVATVTSASGIWRKPGIVCLLVLALPWTASLDFFLGYPLRLLTSINARFLLEILGMDVTRSGVQLLYEGRIVGVDPACSGMNMLWSTGLLTALLASVFSLRWRSLVPLGLVALVLALAGNSLRAAVLFFPEAGIVEMPHLLHPGIGIAIAGVCFLGLMKLARKLSSPPSQQQHGSTSPKLLAVSSMIIATLFVLLASLFSTKETTQPISVPPILTSYQGSPVTRIPLSPSEENFYRSFPGSIAVYEGTEFKLIVRHVNRATRKLHPASHCMRSEGFWIGEKTVVTDGNDDRWLSYKIARNGETFWVRERITCTAKDQNWSEISAWYWHAFFHPGDGPWQAVTVIVAHPATLINLLSESTHPSQLPEEP